MQTYPLALSPTNISTIINAQATGFWFESGASTGDGHIILKPDTGDEITIKAGQSVRVPGRPTKWSIALKDPTVTLTGVVHIGDGEFNDNNTNSAVTLSSSTIADTTAIPIRKQQLATIVHYAPVTVNTGPKTFLVLDTALKQMRFRNTSASAKIYIGGTNVSIANAVMVLNPGDVWMEEEMLGTTLYAVTDVDGATLNMMGLKL